MQIEKCGPILMRIQMFADKNEKYQKRFSKEKVHCFIKDHLVNI